MITLPTLSAIKTRITNSIQTQFGITLPLIGKNFLQALSAVLAGEFKLFYLVIGNLQKNIFADTADEDQLYRWGLVKLGRQAFPPVAGQYEIIITGSIGATIKASTTFKSDDSSLSPGYLFILDEAYTLISTTDSIIVRALTPGEESKLNALDTLTATSPIILVDSKATVYSEIVEPLAGETLEAYRTAILNSYRLETQGGAATDYRLWSQDAQGVRFVYPYVRSGYLCEINLFVEATVVDSTDGKGTPSSLLLAAVQSVVEFNPDTTIPLLERGRRPLDVIVNYLPITPKQIDITITNFMGLDADTETILLNAITEMINSMRPFVAAADILSNKNDILDVNKIIGAIIGQKPGAIFTSVSFTVDGSPLLTYTFIDGNIPWLNSVNYV